MSNHLRARKSSHLLLLFEIKRNMEATTDLFINLIRNHRIIYDTKSRDFKNVNKKEDEWVVIAKESRMTVEAAKKRYASLRQKYAREKKREITCSRTKQLFRPSMFFDRLSFLNDFVKPRRTFTNDVDGMDLMENDACDDTDDQVLETPYTTFFTDGYYSIAQEQADDEAALAEMEQESLLPVENAIEILEDIEIAPISQSAVGEPFILVLNENEDELKRMQTQPNGVGSSTQSESFNNSREGQQHESSQLSFETQPSYNLAHNDHNYLRANVPTSRGLEVRDRSIEPQRDGSSTSIPTKSTHGTGQTLTINRDQSTGKVTSSILSKSSPVVQGVSASHEQNRPSAKDTNKVAEAHDTMSAQPTLSVNRSQSTGRVTSSILSKHSPIVQAACASRPSGKGANNATSMDAIKERMEAYLTACNDNLRKKSDRSPHAKFLSYLGTKMENIPKEKVELLEQELFSVVFRYSAQN